MKKVLMFILAMFIITGCEKEEMTPLLDTENTEMILNEAQAESRGKAKVKVCHQTGSETNPYVLIEISENALNAHLNHEDGLAGEFDENGEVVYGDCVADMPGYRFDDQCETIEVSEICGNDMDDDCDGQIDEDCCEPYPEWLLGSWEGNAYQPGWGTWPIELTIAYESVDIYYPSFPCGGYWEYISCSGISFRFIEHITYGSRCISGCTIDISLNQLGNLDYEVSGCGTASGELEKVL